MSRRPSLFLTLHNVWWIRLITCETKALHLKLQWPPQTRLPLHGHDFRNSCRAKGHVTPCGGMILSKWTHAGRRPAWVLPTLRFCVVQPCLFCFRKEQVLRVLQPQTVFLAFYQQNL